MQEEKFHQPHRVAGTYHQERGFNKVAAAILILDIDMPNYSSPYYSIAHIIIHTHCFFKLAFLNA